MKAATPAQLGYRMPAEWEPHAATWLAWPHNTTDWPGKFAPIPWVYAEIIRNLARYEGVELVVNNSAAARQAHRILERAEALSDNIRFHRWPTNRVWLRDSGCIFLKYHQPTLGWPGGPDQIPPDESREGREFTRAVKSSRNTRVLASEGTLALKFRFNAWAK